MSYISAIQEYLGGSEPLTFAASGLDQESPLLRLPPEILESVVSKSLDEVPLREAARSAVLFGRVSVLAYQFTQDDRFSEIIHRAKFLMAAKTLSLAFKITDDLEYLTFETENLHHIFQKILPTKRKISNEEFSHHSIGGLHIFPLWHKGCHVRFGEMFILFSRRITSDLLKRFGWNPSKEIDFQNFMEIMHEVSLLHYDDITILKYPACHRNILYIMHADVLANHTSQELKQISERYQQQARELCKARMPEIYAETKALESEFFSLADSYANDMEKSLEVTLARQYKASTERKTLTRLSVVKFSSQDLLVLNQPDLIQSGKGFFRGRLADHWAKIVTDEEIGEAIRNAALFRALSFPRQTGPTEEFMKFFLLINLFTLHEEYSLL